MAVYTKLLLTAAEGISEKLVSFLWKLCVCTLGFYGYIFMSVVVSPCWAAELNHNHSITPPPLKHRGRKYDEKGLRGWHKDREITH